VTERAADHVLGDQLDLGGVLLGHLVDELLGHRRDRAEVDTDPDRCVALLGLLDDLADILVLADVARVQPQTVDSGVERLECQCVFEVDVGDQRNRSVWDDVVSAVAIDWTTIGAPPPMRTLPTYTGLVRRRGASRDTNYLLMAGGRRYSMTQAFS
jgi:hypothetical protein